MNKKRVTAYDLIENAGPHYAPAKTAIYSAYEDGERGGALRHCIGVYSTSEAAWDKIERRKQKLGEVRSSKFHYNVVTYGLDQDVWGT